MRHFLVAVTALSTSAFASPVLAQINGIVVWDPPAKSSRHAKSISPGAGPGSINVQVFFKSNGRHHIVADGTNAAISDGGNAAIHVTHTCGSNCTHHDEADVDVGDARQPVMVTSTGPLTLKEP